MHPVRGEVPDVARNPAQLAHEGGVTARDRGQVERLSVLVVLRPPDTTTANNNNTVMSRIPSRHGLLVHVLLLVLVLVVLLRLLLPLLPLLFKVVVLRRSGAVAGVTLLLLRMGLDVSGCRRPLPHRFLRERVVVVRVALCGVAGWCVHMRACIRIGIRACAQAGWWWRWSSWL